MQDKQAIVDFLIVGSMKAGTTSLHHWLMQSEEISMISGKSKFFNREERFKKGEREYRKSLPQPSEGRLIGDDTPTYSFLPEVPARIFSMVPDVKILWILRDPLQRAISQYWHAVRDGLEDRPINSSFKAELDGNTHVIWQQYLRRSCYKEQVVRYLNFFPRGNVHFIDHRAFVKNVPEEKEKIAKFLGIGPLNTAVPCVNKAEYAPSPKVNKILKFFPLGCRCKDHLRKLLRAYRKPHLPTLDDVVRLEAREYLEKENAGIETLIGFRL